MLRVIQLPTNHLLSYLSYCNKLKRTHRIVSFQENNSLHLQRDLKIILNFLVGDQSYQIELKSVSML